MLGVHSPDGRVTRIHREEVTQIRHQSSEVSAEEQDGLLHLVGDRCLAVALLDAEGALQHVDHGIKSEAPSERDAVPFEPRHLVAQPEPALVAQPGLCLIPAPRHRPSAFASPSKEPLHHSMSRGESNPGC
jgi:hypothetical protein